MVLIKKKNPCIHDKTPCIPFRATQKRNTLLRYSNHVHHQMSCGKKILKTNLAKPLPRLALAPFHGEVMKQQV